jgi:hypothetical protein
MMDNLTDSTRTRPLFTAGILAGAATLLTAFAGVVMFLAGSVVLNLAPPSGLPALASLLAQGPLGYAAFMALLMTCGAPVVGLGVFAMLYFGRPHAD